MKNNITESVGELVLLPQAMQDKQDNTDILLKTLGWIGDKSVNNLEELISRYLYHPNSDIREAACEATAILPREQAVKLLHQFQLKDNI